MFCSSLQLTWDFTTTPLWGLEYSLTLIPLQSIWDLTIHPFQGRCGISQFTFFTVDVGSHNPSLSGSSVLTLSPTDVRFHNHPSLGPTSSLTLVPLTNQYEISHSIFQMTIELKSIPKSFRSYTTTKLRIHLLISTD